MFVQKEHRKALSLHHLKKLERRYLTFAERFEREFLSQGEFENRSIDRTLDIAWDVLSTLPETDLVRIDEELIRKYYPKESGKT